MINKCYCAQFRAYRSNRCGDMVIFRFFKDGGRSPVRHFGFLKVRSFRWRTVRRANMCHLAKFRADRSNRCGGMTDFRFLR